MTPSSSSPRLKEGSEKSLKTISESSDDTDFKRLHRFFCRSFNLCNLNLICVIKRFPYSKIFQKSLFTILSALLIIILISGCEFKEEQLYSKDEAERKFIRICKDEYNWGVNTKLIGNTFWIYLPYQKDIFKFKANRFGQMTKCAVGYLKGDFSERIFYFEYQITSLLKSEEDRGYTYGLIDQVGEDFHYLLNVIYRVYFNAQQQPEFYVIVMADIANGVEVIYTIYNDDLKRIYNNAIPQEEYYKRILQETRGNLAIINDKIGRYLTYKEINFDQFLTEQIIQRIRIKFVGADFKLCRAPKEEILKIISYCVGTYEFQDFSKVILKDLSSGAQITKTRLALEEIKEF